MNNKREKLIKNALMDKINGELNIYSADDILTAADISEEERRELVEKIHEDIYRIVEKKKK
jgi:hypothetical protein